MAQRKYESHPQSAPGDFYVINQCCVTCGVPQMVAPDLVGWTVGQGHCIWKHQPQTPEETERAINVVLRSDMGCHRYSGDDPEIIKLLGPDFCDSE